MKVKEASKRWKKKVDWIRRRCREGIIYATKEHFRWVILDEAEVPPCTGNEACLILENINEREKGKEVILFPRGFKNNSEAIMDYLKQWGFIAMVSDDSDVIAYSVTERGWGIIHNNKRKGKMEVVSETDTLSAGIGSKYTNVSTMKVVEKKKS